MAVHTEQIHIDVNEITRCMVLGDEQLLELAIRDLEIYLLWSPLFILSSKRKPGTVKRVFDEYRKLKKGAQKQAGAILLSPLRRKGRGKICIEYDYCKRKSEIFDAINNTVDNPEIVVVATELSESLDWVVDIIKEILEIIGDTAIPISFIILSIKQGLDDLCKCCEECDGSGFSGNGDSCEICGGSGVKASSP